MWRVDAMLYSCAKKGASQVFIDKNSINHIAFPASSPASKETKGAERATLLLIEATTSDAATSDIRVPLIYDPTSRLFGDFLPAINVRHVAAAAASLIWLRL